jgi:hypothetical protein
MMIAIPQLLIIIFGIFIGKVIGKYLSSKLGLIVGIIIIFLCILISYITLFVTGFGDLGDGYFFSVPMISIGISIIINRKKMNNKDFILKNMHITSRLYMTFFCAR